MTLEVLKYTMYRQLIYFNIMVFLCACTQHHRPIPDVGQNIATKKTDAIEALYEEAAKLMHERSFKKAARKFEKFQELYPYSKWALQARLMGGYCLYQAHHYDDAIDEFTVFAKLHPFHKDTPYAYYMIGLSYYERIAIVERDQEDSEKALQAFQTVIQLAPFSQYAKDAKFKIDFILNHLAVREMQIGRFYQKECSYLAAINRFKNVMARYSSTEQRPEALFRLIECYKVLNLNDEAEKTLAVLKLNHPSNAWTQKALNIEIKKNSEKKSLRKDVKQSNNTNKKVR